MGWFGKKWLNETVTMEKRRVSDVRRRMSKVCQQKAPIKGAVNKSLQRPDWLSQCLRGNAEILLAWQRLFPPLRGNGMASAHRL